MKIVYIFYGCGGKKLFKWKYKYIDVDNRLETYNNLKIIIFFPFNNPFYMRIEGFVQSHSIFHNIKFLQYYAP
jgi:hypothetical protein